MHADGPSFSLAHAWHDAPAIHYNYLRASYISSIYIDYCSFVFLVRIFNLLRSSKKNMDPQLLPMESIQKKNLDHETQDQFCTLFIPEMWGRLFDQA
jgi:hypothetical protein